MDSALLRAIQELGLNDKESQVYLALLELGQADVTEIAQYTRLGRSNVYVLLDKLIQQGIAQESGDTVVKQFRAIEPRQLLQRAKNRVKNFQEMLPLFEAIRARPGDRPRIQYFEGKEAVLNAFQEIYQYRGGTMHYITSMQRLLQHMPEEAAYWKRQHKANNGAMPGKHLLSRTPEDKAFAKAVRPFNQEVRFLPSGKTFDMDFILYGNSVGITALGNPMYLIIQQSHQIADSFQTMFDLLWETASEK